MKINIGIVAAIGFGVFKVNDSWAFQVPFIIILLEES